MKKSVLLILTAIFMLIGARPAEAATCSGSSCNGQDPVATGCSSDAYGVKSREFVDETSMILGTIYVLYSPTCQTVWAEVYANFTSTNWISAHIDGGYVRTLYGDASVVSPMSQTSSPSSEMACGTINVTYESIWGPITTQQSTCTL
jgi:hypothetical protein